LDAWVGVPHLLQEGESSKIGAWHFEQVIGTLRSAINIHPTTFSGDIFSGLTAGKQLLTPKQHHLPGNPWH